MSHQMAKKVLPSTKSILLNMITSCCASTRTSQDWAFRLTKPFCDQNAVDKWMLNGGGMALLPSLSLIINIFGSDWTNFYDNIFSFSSYTNKSQDYVYSCNSYSINDDMSDY